MGGSTFELGTPFTNPVQQVPWGVSPYGSQGLSISPFALQGQPLANVFSSSPIGSGYGPQPLQQVLQLLQLMPQQLQQLEHLQLQQIQQVHQLQQLVQVIPAQLSYLQQANQLASRQSQQPWQFQQPFGQVPTLGSYALVPPWGTPPQILGAQPGHVM
jgi:hypothetical protein